MKYFVLVRMERKGQWTERTREFDDYDSALSYAKYEYELEADNISVCLYELKNCFH